MALVACSLYIPLEYSYEKLYIIMKEALAMTW